MTDLAQGQAARPGIATATPSSMPSRPTPVPGDSGRATAKAVLDAALSGVELTATDRRFLARLSQWDKRNATAVASLIARARQRGHREATLTPLQLEVVLAALMDAFEYRTSGAASAACWDCTSKASGLCAIHAGDADRARGFADLAASLGGMATPAVLPRLDAVPQFRRRAAIAS